MTYEITSRVFHLWPGKVDRIRWKQDLIEDRNRLTNLHAAARQVDAARDAKLAALREEKQMARKVALNLELKRIEAAMAAARKRL